MTLDYLLLYLFDYSIRHFELSTYLRISSINTYLYSIVVFYKHVTISIMVLQLEVNNIGFRCTYSNLNKRFVKAFCAQTKNLYHWRFRLCLFSIFLEIIWLISDYLQVSFKVSKY